MICSSESCYVREGDTRKHENTSRSNLKTISGRFIEARKSLQFSWEYRQGTPSVAVFCVSGTVGVDIHTTKEKKSVLKGKILGPGTKDVQKTPVPGQNTIALTLCLLNWGY